MDYKSPIEVLQEYIKKNYLGAFLVLTKVNRQYLSGFTGSQGVLLIYPPPFLPQRWGGKKGGELYVDDRYLIRARRESWLPVKKLETLRLRLRVTKRVGVEDKISLRELKWLKKQGRGFVPTRDVVENLRAVKSPSEIAAIRRASRIVDATFRHLKKFIRTGMTEVVVALELERFAKKLGATALAFDPIVAWGENAAAPHHLSRPAKIGRNNFLLLDFGVLVDGYHSDFTRTVFIGRPNKKQEVVYNTVLEAQTRAIREIREGVGASRVDTAARRYIGSHGYGKYFTHNTGHGVGLEIHELPNFAKDSEDVLKKNMVVTVEPGIYIEKWGGVRIEDMVVVAERGAKVLSRIPKDLQAMIIR